MGDYIPIATLSPPTGMTCIKVGSDESCFNFSLIVRDKVTRQCPQTTTLKRKESRGGIEPRSFRLRLTARPVRLTLVRGERKLFLSNLIFRGSNSKEGSPGVERASG